MVIAETMKLIQDDAVIDAIVAEVMELQDQENATSSGGFGGFLHLFESFGSFCHPVFGQVLGSPSINVLKFSFPLNAL